LQLGDWATAMRYLERAEAMARRLPESLHVALIMGSRGLSNLHQQKALGDLDLLRASLQAAEAAGSHIYTTFSRYFLGQWHFLLAEFSEALIHFEAALAIAEQPGNLFQPATLLWTAETEARLGLHDAACAHLCRYEQLIERLGSLEGLAWFPSRGVAHRIHGLLLTRRKAFSEACDEFDRSLELLAAHGYKPDLARTHVALGECERERGRSPEARRAFETAATCFREMGFTCELQRTLRRLEDA
jgi:tetratricopeptide (TPR) repeat protein